MRHASGAAAAAEDDTVCVALHSVQHLGVTDHARRLRRPGLGDKEGDDGRRELTTRPARLALTATTWSPRGPSEGTEVARAGRPPFRVTDR